MNKLSKILVMSFLGVSILSLITGAGLIQTILISVGFVLLLLILIISVAISIYNKKNWWWNVYKPNFAITTAWGILHLIIALIQSDVTQEIWLSHLGWLVSIELSAFVLNTIVNKNIDFEKRASRWIMEITYVLLLISLIGSLYLRLFHGDVIADFNRLEIAALKNSKIENLVFKIERNSKKHEFELVKTELEDILKKSEEVSLSKSVLNKLEVLEARGKKIFASSDKPFNSSNPKSNLPPRPLSGAFEVPAGEKVETGLAYGPGDTIQYEQLGTPAEFEIVGKRFDITVPARRYFSTTGTLPGQVTIKGGKEPARLRVEIIKNL